MSSYILGTKPQHWATSVMRVRARETLSSDPTTLASQVSVKCSKSTLAPVFSMAFLSVAKIVREHIPGSVWHSRPTLLCRSDSQISFGENNGLIYKELLEVPVVEKIFWTGV